MTRVSLAVICGNVAGYVTRFLEVFEPLVDEIVMVRACGAAEPDETLAIAEARGCITEVYENGPAGADWPHVDHFARARNQALRRCSGEWIVWADTDDVISPESVKVLRETMERCPEEIDGILVPYVVPEDAITTLRERCVRANRWQWQDAVHEALQLIKPREPKLGTVSGATVVHAPDVVKGRAPNDARNLRILEHVPKEDRTLKDRFHLAITLKAVGREDEAREEMATLVAEPALPKDERFECFLNLGTMMPDVQRGKQMTVAALVTDPTRREAFGDLTAFEFQSGRTAEMLAWARAMRVQPAPRDAERPWNLRSKYYAWAGVQLEAMARRANGDVAGADALEWNHFLQSGARISLLHASRGRPREAAKARKLWLDRASNPDAIEHVFALDADDEASGPLTLWRHVVVAPGGGCVRAWNAAAAVSGGEVLVQLSDDWEPPQGWDEEILARLPVDPSEPWVLAVSDGHREDDLLCMAILNRARYAQQGHLFHPAFKSMYSDNWFSWKAFRDEVVTRAPDLVFVHHHPAFENAVKMDRTYAESNAPERYEEGRRVFEELVAMAVSGE